MSQLPDDLRAECEALDALVAPLSAADWARRTVFYDWSVWDEIVHLYFLDGCALASLQNPNALTAMVAERRADQAVGLDLSERLRRRYADLDKDALLTAWRQQYRTMCGAFATLDPSQRTRWFGPDMSVGTLAIARQMEVWAHGQDVFDLFGVRRHNADRIRNICDLGVRTYGWSFRNRGEDPAQPPPQVILTAPSGVEWSWNPNGEGAVIGSAVDFALVVTQRRNVADTRLDVTGPTARRWTAIAQCFAGAPSDGPEPGGRTDLPAETAESLGV